MEIELTYLMDYEVREVRSQCVLRGFRYNVIYSSDGYPHGIVIFINDESKLFHLFRIGSIVGRLKR
ncbi:hypothetical protein HZQ30_18530 [Elizabethkingia anophelis]|nr:hypothetical protein [Elizabethkingia anophelis]MCT3939606.1 hypothetical protein [Elizabethkingia anophelis]